MARNRFRAYFAIAGDAWDWKNPFQSAQRGSERKAATRHCLAQGQAEAIAISQALNRTRWNRKRAAEQLDISYKALLYKIKQYDLERPLSAS